MLCNLEVNIFSFLALISKQKSGTNSEELLRQALKKSRKNPIVSLQLVVATMARFSLKKCG